MAKTKDRRKRRVRKSEARTANARATASVRACNLSIQFSSSTHNKWSFDGFFFLSCFRRFTNLPPFRRMAICSCTSIFHFESKSIYRSADAIRRSSFDMRNGLGAQTTIAEEEPNKLRRNCNKNDLVRDLCEIYSMMWTESHWLCAIVPSLVSSESLHFAHKFLPNSVCLREEKMWQKQKKINNNLSIERIGVRRCTRDADERESKTVCICQ